MTSLLYNKDYCSLDYKTDLDNWTIEQIVRVIINIYKDVIYRKIKRLLLIFFFLIQYVTYNNKSDKNTNLNYKMIVLYI